jgi:hypothetical protein
MFLFFGGVRMTEEAVPKRLTRRTWSAALLNFKKMMVMLRDRWSEARIGISSDNVLFIDCDLTLESCRSAFMDILNEIYNVVQTSLFVFRTERGMHVIPCASYFNRGLALDALEGLRGVYRAKRKRGMTEKEGTAWWAERFGTRYPSEVELDAMVDAVNRVRHRLYIWEDAYTEIKSIPHVTCVDTMHIDISLQRHYTTLRAIPKPSKPMDIEFLGVFDGKLVRVDFENVLGNPQRYLKCRRFDFDTLARMWVDHVQRFWIARGATIDMRVVNALIRYIKASVAGEA